MKIDKKPYGHVTYHAGYLCYSCKQEVEVEFDDTDRVVSYCPYCGELQAFVYTLPLAILNKLPKPMKVDGSGEEE